MKNSAMRSPKCIGRKISVLGEVFEFKSSDGKHHWSIVYKGFRSCIHCGVTKPASAKK